MASPLTEVISSNLQPTLVGKFALKCENEMKFRHQDNKDLTFAPIERNLVSRFKIVGGMVDIHLSGRRLGILIWPAFAS